MLGVQLIHLNARKVLALCLILISSMSVKVRFFTQMLKVLIRVTVKQINLIRIFSCVNRDQVLSGVSNYKFGLLSSLELLEYLQLPESSKNFDQIHFFIKFFDSSMIKSIKL